MGRCSGPYAADDGGVDLLGFRDGAVMLRPRRVVTAGAEQHRERAGANEAACTQPTHATTHLSMCSRLPLSDGRAAGEATYPSSCLTPLRNRCRTTYSARHNLANLASTVQAADRAPAYSVETTHTMETGA